MIWIWFGYDLDMSWIWVGYELDMSWIWFGYELDMIWIWFGYDLDMIWIWFGYDLDMIWIWFGYDLDMIWIWFGYDLDMSWIWFGYDLDGLTVHGLMIFLQYQCCQATQKAREAIQKYCGLTSGPNISLLSWSKRTKRTKYGYPLVICYIAIENGHL